MKYYDAFNNSWFGTTIEEIKELQVYDSYCHTPKLQRYNLMRINNKFKFSFGRAIEFSIRRLPFKRSKNDNGFLMVIRHENGLYQAKRQQLNQWLHLSLTEEGIK